MTAETRPSANSRDSATSRVLARPSADSRPRTPRCLSVLAALQIVLGVYLAFLAIVALFAVSRPERSYTFFGLVEVPPGWLNAVDNAAFGSLYVWAGIGLLRRSRPGWWLALALWIERVPDILRTLGTDNYTAWFFVALSLPMILWLLRVRRYCRQSDK